MCWPSWNKITRKGANPLLITSTYTAHLTLNTRISTPKVLHTQDKHTQLSSFAWLCCNPIKAVLMLTRQSMCQYRLAACALKNSKLGWSAN